VIHVMG